MLICVCAAMEHLHPTRLRSAFGNLTFLENAGGDRCSARPYRVALYDPNHYGTFTGINSQICTTLAPDDDGGQGSA